MDNEPSIWNSTHDDVALDSETAEEYIQKYFKVAKAARAKYPEIKLVKEQLVKHGALGALMSGSGPTVFGLFSYQEKADAITYSKIFMIEAIENRG